MACREQRWHGSSTGQLLVWPTFTYTELSGERSHAHFYRSLQCIRWRRPVPTDRLSGHGPLLDAHVTVSWYTHFMKYTPLISIVTPSFNQANYIGEALASVRLQNNENWEHLVIDGVSTDGTIDLLRGQTKNGDQQKMFWLSEKDGGQSEALNKGFRRATGEIVGWLNSDDRYRAKCFERVVHAFEDNPDVDIIYGDYLIVDEAGKGLKIKREIEFNAFVFFYHRILYIPTTSKFFFPTIF